MTNDTYYITTPIYYVNDKPHLGHAYTSVACDALARFMRLDGAEVKFLTGTDEHGQKVEKSAKSAGVPPHDFVDEVSEHFRHMNEVLQLSNDDFIRTTQPRHIAAAQAIWKALEASGDIYLGSYSGWYSVRDEAFYAESELVEGKAPTGAEVEWVEEPSYFFKLSKYQQPLLDYYKAHPDFILPESRRNEIMRFVEGGLHDLSISRTTFKWGVPVPGDEKHIMYVWLDALTNYLTAVGYPDQQSAEYQKFWPAGLHMVGKDIVRFHAVYWPAFLMSAKLPVPQRIFAHGWWTIEGEKMSKSLGNVVSPTHLVERYGLDQTRYFLLREVPFGSDGNFSRQAMFDRINADLANNIGNLAQRTLSMIAKNCDGKVPTNDTANLTEADSALMELVRVTNSGTPNSARDQMQRCKFGEVTGAILAMASSANEYIDREAPWKLKKENPARMESVLYYLAESIRCIAIMLQPFTPGAAEKLLDQLAVPKDQRLFKHLTAEFALTPGTELPKPEGVFPRLVVEETA
jgi:methionyl-tRNA synthetase